MLEESFVVFVEPRSTEEGRPGAWRSGMKMNGITTTHEEGVH